MDINYWFLAFCGLAFILFVINSAYEKLWGLAACFVGFLAITQYYFRYDLLTYVRNNLLVIVLSFFVYLMIGLLWGRFKWGRVVAELVSLRNNRFESFYENLPRNMKDYFSSLGADYSQTCLDKDIASIESIDLRIRDMSKENIFGFLKKVTSGESWESLYSVNTAIYPNKNIDPLYHSYKALYSIWKNQNGYGILKPKISDYKDKFIGWFLFWPFYCVAYLFNDLLKDFCNSIYCFFARKLQDVSDRMWS